MRQIVPAILLHLSLAFGISAQPCNGEFYLELTDSVDIVTQLNEQESNKITSLKLNLKSNIDPVLLDELPCLTSLYLVQYDGKINDFPFEHSALKNLERLSIIGFEQLNWDSTFSTILHQKHLTFLSIENCNLTSIPQEIRDLSQLQKLKLNGNQIRQLPNSLSELLELKKLEIRNNLLSEIPIIPSIEQIDAIGNQLDRRNSSIQYYLNQSNSQFAYSQSFDTLWSEYNKEVKEILKKDSLAVIPEPPNFPRYPYAKIIKQNCFCDHESSLEFPEIPIRSENGAFIPGSNLLSVHKKMSQQFWLQYKCIDRLIVRNFIMGLLPDSPEEFKNLSILSLQDMNSLKGNELIEYLRKLPSLKQLELETLDFSLKKLNKIKHTLNVEIVINGRKLEE